MIPKKLQTLDDIKFHQLIIREDTMFEGMNMDEIKALYNKYLEADSIKAFLKENGIETTPILFSKSLPHVKIKEEFECPNCTGNHFSRPLSRRSDFNAMSATIEFSCLTEGCGAKLQPFGWGDLHSSRCNCKRCKGLEISSLKEFTNLKRQNLNNGLHEDYFSLIKDGEKVLGLFTGNGFLLSGDAKEYTPVDFDRISQHPFVGKVVPTYVSSRFWVKNFMRLGVAEIINLNKLQRRNIQSSVTMSPNGDAVAINQLNEILKALLISFFKKHEFEDAGGTIYKSCVVYQSKGNSWILYGDEEFFLDDMIGKRIQSINFKGGLLVVATSLYREYPDIHENLVASVNILNDRFYSQPNLRKRLGVMKSKGAVKLIEQCL